jgi:hypothetical protein
MLVFIEENANCPEGGSWRFNSLEAPRTVAAVRLHRHTSEGEWYDIVGWRAGSAGAAMCGATVQKIDDSGQGVAYLIVGGDGGVRLKPRGSGEAWALRNRAQWGEPYLVVPSAGDFLLAESDAAH